MGCLKSSIGHSEGASGLASLAKAVVVHQNRMIPPNIHFRSPNPNIKGLMAGDLVPVLKNTPLSSRLIPVNCFGFGGSNVHVVTERHDATTGHVTYPRLIPLCARTPDALYHLKQAITREKKYMDGGFLWLLQHYAASEPVDYMTHRGYAIALDHEHFLANSHAISETPRELTLALHGAFDHIDEDIVQTMKSLSPQFSKTWTALNFLAIERYAFDLMQPPTDNAAKIRHAGHRGARVAAFLLSMVEFLNSLNVKYTHLAASGYGRLVEAHLNGSLSRELLLEASFAIGSGNAEIKYNDSCHLPLMEQVLKDLAFTADVSTSGDVVAVSREGLTAMNTASSNSSNSIRTLEAIGRLFMFGHTINLDAIYPPPSEPIPSSTPFLSPLIKWNHERTYSLVPYLGDKSNNFFDRARKDFDFVFERANNTDQFIYDHVIDSRKLFPATGYLMLAWAALAELTYKDPLQMVVRWRNVRFFKATVMSDTARTRLTVYINKDNGDFEVSENGQPCVTGHIDEIDRESRDSAFVENDVNKDVEPTLDGQDIYKEIRVRGYDYGPFFQGIRWSTFDGRRGQVLFRQVLNAATLNSMKMNDELRGKLFLRSMMAFADTLLQIQLVNPRSDHRCLEVPSGIEYVTCDPEVFLQDVQDADKFDDTVTQSQAALINGQFHSDTNCVATRGLTIRGLKTSVISRRKAQPTLLSYNFRPLVDPRPVTTEQVALRNVLDIVATNVICSGSKKLRVLEHSFRKQQVDVAQLIDGHVLESEMTIEQTRSQLQSNERPIVPEVRNKLHLILLVATPRITKEELTESIKNLNELLVDNGFLVVVGGKAFELDKELSIVARQASVHLIRRQQPTQNARIITVNTQNVKSWLEQLQQEMASDSNQTLWLLPSSDEPTPGAVYGLAKTLRLEPGGHKIRCFVDMDANVNNNRATIDTSSELFKKVLEHDLALNVLDNGQLGTFEHIGFEPTKLDVKTKNSYLRVLKPGDLSTLTWTESDVQPPATSDNLINVHYAALNFRDVMFASGGLNPDAVPFISPLVVQDSLLGLEFAGTTATGRRVMGVVESKAMADFVDIAPCSKFTFDVPESWSLEDASTVPGVYMTAYYALCVRGRLTKGDKVLIHSAAGGVGLAALYICFSMDCDVYVTVGTETKKRFLLDTFKKLKSDHVFNSRSLDFEDDLMTATGGVGVDIVLNSLAEDKLKAGLRCLADGGRFLELGKVDFMKNNALELNGLRNNVTFHGILLDTLTSNCDSIKIKSDADLLVKLMTDGIAKGVVQPLPRTVYARKAIQDAFRFMASGQHVGKVVVDMTAKMGIDKNSARASWFDADKSYVIVGGLGGFGLELALFLVRRGARNLVLTSRSGATTAYHKYAVQRLERMGCRVVVSTLDAADQDQARRLIHLAHNVAPLGGVFNLAAVLKDAFFADLTAADFESSLRPKAHATHNLDVVTREPQFRDMKHFVTFSSLSCGRGNEGQANYNLANGAIEAVCRSRRKLGLPGLAIQMGAIGDVGMVVDKMAPNAPQTFAAKGFAVQRVNSCLEALDQLLQSDRAVVTCYVKADKTANDDQLNAGDVVKVIANIMGLKDASGVPSDAPLGRLGIDSLIAVEVKQVVERAHGVNLSVKEIRALTFDDLHKMQDKSKAR